MKTHEKLTWILFAFVVIALYLFALDLPLLGPDEPRYSQVAREMYERGDWITTTLGGFNWFEKPALLYWLQITFYNIFGVSEFSARLGSALFGLGTIGSLFWLGKSVVSEHQSGTKYLVDTSELPFWLALVTASSIGLIAFSRGASFDIILTFPITASLVSFFIWELKSTGPNAKRIFNCLIAFYFFIGVALIAKGLVGIVFPFAIVTFYYVLRLKTPSKTLIYSLFWGTVLSVVVACIWYIPVYLQNGWEFIDEFFIQHHFQRFSSNKFQHPQPFWFFWLVLPLMTTPWIPFFVKSIWDLVKRGFSRKAGNTKGDLLEGERQLQTFAFAWMLVPLAFFSLSGSKLPGYVLPSLPAACILTGLAVTRFVRSSRIRRVGLQLLAFATVTVVAFLLQFALPNFANNDSVKNLVTIADRDGFPDAKIVGLRTRSHSLEFYGAGRLVRDQKKQKQFESIDEITEYMNKNDLDKILVLAPPKNGPERENYRGFEIGQIFYNNEYVMWSVSKKQNK